ncbi:hypothetical protein ACFO0N_01405 [Halobium salinum]|uniref:Uncharacterized protein n=1 Tax=Halobium salinum TaxID=1364940 RepID=A0ABD5P7X7_9EURY|nr:hypothetical protein [Halobium salinum]
MPIETAGLSVSADFSTSIGLSTSVDRRRLAAVRTVRARALSCPVEAEEASGRQRKRAGGRGSERVKSNLRRSGTKVNEVEEEWDRSEPEVRS